MPPAALAPATALIAEARRSGDGLAARLADALEWAQAQLAGATDEDAEMLAAVAAVRGDRSTSTARLIELADALVTLRAALIGAVGEPLTAQRLGCRFRHLEGLSLRGRRIVREGRDKTGAVWAVRPR
ncbi:hypothetical protein DJ019_02355 [Phenylobacterium kunshanense]|uniref:Uncharacterized protein n=1 Tax=Phenylobacterium kunshanense TaxID=1445034 RepID=A0A328BS93_9CAUL|nr:hypothetical protein DJ019_02355 [Phenylobacterium kunshanense]